MANPLPPLDFADADRLLPGLWARLATPVFRTQTLATVGPDGAPRARTVILRTVDPSARTIACHADVTSPKVAELRRDPRAAWVGWDSNEKLQIRVESTVAVHTDDAVADALWRSQSESNLAIYRIERPAAEPIARPEEAGRRASPDRARFAAIVADVLVIEWLSLAEAELHRRGRFTLGAGGEMTHAYLVP